MSKRPTAIGPRETIAEAFHRIAVADGWDRAQELLRIRPLYVFWSGVAGFEPTDASTCRELQSFLQIYPELKDVAEVESMAEAFYQMASTTLSPTGHSEGARGIYEAFRERTRLLPGDNEVQRELEALRILYPELRGLDPQ